MAIAETVTATGLLNADEEPVILSCAGAGGVAFQIGPGLSGTITFQGSADGINYHDLLVASIGGTDGVTTTTSAGVYRACAVGLLTVQARITTYSSGECQVTIRAVNASPSLPFYLPSP